MASDRYLDLRHGPHEPTTGTPPRRPGSVRRTTTVDALRPRNLYEGLHLSGRARDLVTHHDGSTTVVGHAEMEVELAYTGGAVVQQIDTTPDVAGLEALVGRIATTGFRAIIDSD